MDLNQVGFVSKIHFETKILFSKKIKKKKKKNWKIGKLKIGKERKGV